MRRKTNLKRIVTMLNRLIQRTETVSEGCVEYEYRGAGYATSGRPQGMHGNRTCVRFELEASIVPAPRSPSLPSAIRQIDKLKRARHAVLQPVFVSLLLAAFWLVTVNTALAQRSKRPNIIYIYADDLGFGELGCYGQTKIKTPHLDRLAATGMRFTQHYSGSAVCAPSRCVLLTGLHSGHAYIRDNDEMAERGDVWNDPDLEGQRPLLPGTMTLGRYLQGLDYRTACIGKWGLGGPLSTGHPQRQGFDLFFGYLCQREAHNYYPTHLWRNNTKVVLNNPPFRVHERLSPVADLSDPETFARFQGQDYAVDHTTAEALRFVAEDHQRPFFLLLSYTMPHLALQVPTEALQVYLGNFAETPYLGDAGYCPHATPRAAYAAMITLLDDQVGKLVRRLEELGIERNTLIMFSSDNGPTYVGGVDRAFFDSTAGLRGHKGQLYEGGIRVPMIANWPGVIAPGQKTDHISAQWDVFPTIADVVAEPPPAGLDGVSFWPTLIGEGTQRPHAFLYWEHAGRRAVRAGRWKAIQTGLRKNPDAPVRLYDLDTDRQEAHDRSGDRPEIVTRMRAYAGQRTPSAFDKWNF